MLSAFQEMPLIIISINRLRHQPDNILTASLERSFAELTSLNHTESATHYSTPLDKARHRLLARLHCASQQEGPRPSHRVLQPCNARSPASRLQRCQVQPHSSCCLARQNALACLHALPTAPALRFDHEKTSFVFAIVLRIILGMSLIPPSSLQVRCYCGKAWLSSVHAQVCTVSHQQSYRHDNIVDLLFRALRQAFLSPKKEQLTTIGTKRWDLVFFNPDFIKALHKLIFGDVTVISPIQEEYLNDTILKDINIPMNDAYKHKVAHYSEDITVQPPGSIFLPLVLDSLGGIHNGLLQLLFNASPHAQQQPPARSKNHTCWRYPDYWIQAVSVANFTGTARSVIKTIELSLNNACLS
jgi:hypothetical protein